MEKAKVQAVNEIWECPEHTHVGEVSFNYGFKSGKSDQFWGLNPRPPPTSSEASARLLHHPELQFLLLRNRS